LIIAARSRTASTLLSGSSAQKRRMPFFISNRNASRMISAGVRSQLMKRSPLVRKPSGVSGIAAAARRMRSHGSSWWNRTLIAMWVLVMNSIAS
jgi:hypothetical protein